MPDAPASPPAGSGGAKGKVENPMTVLILGFVTCFIYTYYWLWIRSKEMNDYLGKQQVNPMFVFPGCFCPPLVIYADYLFAKGIPDMQKKAGVEAKDEFVLHLLLLILLPPVGQFMIQQKLNELWAK